MNKIEDLIKKLCPNGVEYKTLVELGDFYGGLTGKSKDDFKGGNAKFISYMNVFKNPALDLSSKETVKIAPDEKQRKLEFGDVIFTGSSETPDECAISSVVTKQPAEDYYLNSFCFIWRIKDKTLFNFDFLKHLFRSDALRQQLIKTASGVTRFNVSKKLMEKIEIPKPPMEIQREIVQILDNFAELSAELSAELQLRRKQYEFYRDKLLKFDDTIQNIELGEIAKFTYGYTDKATDTGDIRYIRITDITDDGTLNPNDTKYVKITEVSKKYLLKKGDLLVARTGATYGKTLYFDSNEPSIYASFLIKIELDNTKVRNKYYWHFSKSSLYWNQAEKYVSKAGQQQFNSNAICKIVVPIPSLEIQDKIIYVLDNFDKICSDLGIGLPAEIEARQKQYEYYREKLLSFDKQVGGGVSLK